MENMLNTWKQFNEAVHFILTSQLRSCHGSSFDVMI